MLITSELVLQSNISEGFRDSGPMGLTPKSSDAIGSELHRQQAEIDLSFRALGLARAARTTRGFNIVKFETIGDCVAHGLGGAAAHGEEGLRAAKRESRLEAGELRTHSRSVSRTVIVLRSRKDTKEITRLFSSYGSQPLP